MGDCKHGLNDWHDCVPCLLTALREAPHHQERLVNQYQLLERQNDALQQRVAVFEKALAHEVLIAGCQTDGISDVMRVLWRLQAALRGGETG